MRPLVLLRVLSIAALLQGVMLHAQVLPLRYYAVEDGLLSNSVRCITQDAAGYLWIGTTEGLSVFDGTVFRNLSVLEGLSNSNVNWIGESRRDSGIMWIATNGGGICRLSGDTLSVIRITDDPVANRVNMVLEDASGVLWCATDAGVFTVRGDSAASVRAPSELREVVSILEDGTDTLLIVGLKGVYRHVTRTGEFVRTALAPGTTGNLTCAVASPDGGFWIGDMSGTVSRLRHGAVVETVRLDRGVYPITLHPGGDGVVWTGTYDGVYGIVGNGPTDRVVREYDVKNGLQDMGITAIFTDREENLWFGGFSGGMSVLSNRNILGFPLGAPIPMANDAAVAVDTAGHSWSVISGGLIEIWRDRRGSWKAVTHDLGGSGGSRTPTAVIYDSGRHGVWVTFEDHSLRFYRIGSERQGQSELKMERVLLPGRDYPRGPLYRFVLDTEGTLYLSIFNEGLAIIDPWNGRGRAEILTESGHGLPGADIRALLVDRSGALWAGGYISGIVKLDREGNEWRVSRKYSTENGLPDNSVRVIFEDRDGKVWVGTRYGGLGIVTGDTIRAIDVRNGLLSNAVWSIAQDSGGAVWIATQSGLQSVMSGGDSVAAVLEDLSGLIVLSCAAGGDGTIWAHGRDEVLLFDSRMPQIQKTPPPIHIAGVRVNGVNHPTNADLSLSAAQSNLSVDITGISFSGPGAIRYRYMLEGIDEDWQGPTPSRTLTYAALPPGRYRLLVKAVTNQGVESASPASLGFSIATPLWRRWWFLLLSAAAAGGAVFGVYRYRVSSLMAVDRVRGRIATDLHDDIGSDLTQIAILSEVAKAGQEPDEARRTLDMIGSMARRVINGMSDLVWYIDPRHDHLTDLVDRIGELAAGLLAGRTISLNVSAGPSIKDQTLPPDVRKELLLTLKEGLTNAVRHSGCDRISMTVGLEGRMLLVSVEDNGMGFDTKAVRRGHGLENMETRIRAIRGEFRIGPAAGGGTLIRITIPLGRGSGVPTHLRS